MRHGGKIIADHLILNGVERVFSVPGESFLAALDGLHGSGITNVVCRHEGGASLMAEAHGKMTGRPGVLFVTRGPGATNASAGVHVASQDSTPMIVFVGQIRREHRDREAFQEIDYRAFFGSVAKWVAEVDQTERLPEYISRAFHVATSGRPGPVILALPEDMLSAHCDAPDLPPPAPRPASARDAEAAAVAELLGKARRPLAIVGGSGWSEKASTDLARLAGSLGLSIAASFRRQDYFDNRHPNFVGFLGVGMSPDTAALLKQADTLLVLGARLSDSATGSYSLLDPGNPGKTIIHVHPDPDEFGRVYRPDLAVAAPAGEVVAALARLNLPAGPGWAEETAIARAKYETWTTPRETPGDVKLEQVIHWLSENLPDDAIVTNGAGNFAAFLHRYFIYKRHGTQLAPTSGSMGYGFPAAISASLQHPDRLAICLAGDGDIQMTINEFSTAIQFGAKPITIVANNGYYGTIRMHQERHYPGRVSGTDLASPDYAALARAYGGHGERVTRTEDFPAAFERARASGLPALIELTLDREALTAGATLSQVRAAAEAASKG